MSELIFILGLCGSGKSPLIESMKVNDPELYAIDEGFNPCANPDFIDKYLKIKESLSKGRNCAVIEIEMCREPFRSNIAGLFMDIPNTQIKYIAFENNLTKANKNLSKPDQRHPEGRKRINCSLSHQYTIPSGAQVVEIKN